MTKPTNQVKPIPFLFDAKTFVQAGYESAAGEWSDDRLHELSVLRGCYPELAHWGDLALGCAWGDYSQDVYEVSWREWKLEERDECFLSYCYWVQTQGPWMLGFDLEILDKVTGWK